MENFVFHKNGFWLKFFCFALAVALLLYFLDSPVGGRNGASLLGIIFGIVATIGMLVLMLFARRKRSYRAHTTTVKGWLSCHVWLGVFLLVLIPLHCGFHIDFNFHSLVYLLSAITIITGIWGVINYVSLAPAVPSHRGGLTVTALLEQLEGILKEVRNLSEGQSSALVKLAQESDPFVPQNVWQALRTKSIPDIDNNKTATAIQGLPKDEQELARKLIGALDRKLAVSRSLCKEVRIHALLKLWLYFHIIVAVATTVALTIHILVVLKYW